MARYLSKCISLQYRAKYKNELKKAGAISNKHIFFLRIFYGEIKEKLSQQRNMAVSQPNHIMVTMETMDQPGLIGVTMETLGQPNIAIRTVN